VAAATEDHYKGDDRNSAVAPNKKDVYSDSDPSRVMVRRRMLALQEEKAEQAVLVLVHAQIVVATTGVRVEVVVLLELGDPRIDIAEYIDDDAVGDNEVVVHVDDASWDTDFDDVDKEEEDDDNTVRRISVTML